jgi:hypothetical protein
MYNFKFIFVILFIYSLNICNLYSADSLQVLNTKIVERPLNLPEIQLFPDYKLKFYYSQDSQFELNEEDIKIAFVIADYLISNPNYSLSLRSWQHENEVKETTVKRNQYIKDLLLQIGVNPKRIISKAERAVIAQDPSDIFTAEELIQARRVDVVIIR